MKTRDVLIIFFCLFALIGCSNPPQPTKYQTIQRMGHRCDIPTVEKRVDFTLQCIANANPKSDEEPEDWIRICEAMSVRVYCPVVLLNVTQQKRSCAGCYWEDIDIEGVTND